ncbi:SpaA isopeptide-forming pilin-related protein, partial [Bacillus cereus]|uniref:SpaA isopeptide-forming pilin-related protein n=1 Tax=Bacillus cereus TaxID=1396 RepID=UPI003D1735D7
MLDVFKQHKVSKVLFSVLSLLMLTISTLIAPIFAHAQEGDPNVVQRASGDWTQMWHEKYQNKGWAKDLNTGYDIETDVIKFGDGSIAYCLEMMLESPDGHSLEEKARLSDEYYKIMNSGYPVKSPAELGASSWQVAHYATQLAVWVTNTDISYDKLQFNNAEVKRVLDKILADSRVSDATQDLTFELTPDHIVAENPPWGNNVKQAGPFTIKTNGEGTFSVEAINAPNPVTFVNNVGEPMTTFKPGDRFYAQVSSDAPTGNFNIRATGNLTKTETLWYKSHNAGIQHTTAIVTLHKTPVAENASVSWDSNGGFEVVKTDENGKVLGGAEFEVTNANGNVVKTFTTDSNGKATITGLDFGEYTVKETKAPNGYTMDATPQKVTVDSKQKSVTFVNKQEKGSIKITKVDDANKPLAGVQFAVYNSKGNMVKTVTTDANGVATVGNLPFDTYTWKETKGLPGYDTVNKTGSFEVNSATKDHEVKVENKKLKGGLHITKVDDKDKPLKGVEFTVYKDGKEVAKATTDANGNVSFDNLETGKYTYKETKGLDGYVSDKTEKPFELTTTNLLHQAKVVNKLISGSLEITKTDDANKPLEGVEFTVFKDGKEFKKVTTDANGKIVLTDLPMGKYTYKETKGLAGYVADTQERAFEVKDLGDTHKATVVNKLIKGSIEITKTDDSNKPLAGVEFTVYKDGKEYTKVTTNDKGIAEVKDLPYGEYTFKETKGIEGYVSDSTTQLVDIKKDGQTDKFTVVNKKIKGSLEIVKTDDAKKPLKGVEFTVYDAKDKEITKVVTDDKGKASVKDLPYGKYYFKETKGLEGYVYDKSNVEFEIKNLNETKSYTVVNKLIRSNIEITKVDNEGKLLEGVEFTIYDSNDKEVAKVVTDAQGKAKYDNLPYGKYYFKETKNLEGYVENGKKYDFDVKQDLQTLKFDVI